MARRRDVTELAEKLEGLVADPALREKIAREGMGFIRRGFDWERAVTRMETVLSAAP